MPSRLTQHAPNRVTKKDLSYNVPNRLVYPDLAGESICARSPGRIERPCRVYPARTLFDTKVTAVRMSCLVEENASTRRPSGRELVTRAAPTRASRSGINFI